MKKKNLLLLAPIALSAALFLGYRTWDGIRKDDTPPVISVSMDNLQVSVSEPRSALLQGITAQDDRDGDVTHSLLVENISMIDNSGAIKVTVAAFDDSGNVSKTIQTARYTDYQPPRFFLNRPLLFAIGSGADMMAAITAWDDLDGDIQHRIRATAQDAAATNTLGDHEVEYSVTNSLGDTVRLTLPVTVYSGDHYGLSLTLKEYLIYLKTGSSFEARDYLSQVKRGLETISFEDDTPNGYSVHIEGDVNVDVPGMYPVDYTVTYVQQTSAGTQYITGISRLIVIVEE